MLLKELLYAKLKKLKIFKKIKKCKTKLNFLNFVIKTKKETDTNNTINKIEVETKRSIINMVFGETVFKPEIVIINGPVKNVAIRHINKRIKVFLEYFVKKDKNMDINKRNKFFVPIIYINNFKP